MQNPEIFAPTANQASISDADGNLTLAPLDGVLSTFQWNARNHGL